MKNKRGFTLIELLIVIGIIAILAAIIYVAVDPARRMQESRDATRWSEVNSILNAVLKYTVDSGPGKSPGVLPSGMSGMGDGLYYVLGQGLPADCDDCGAVSEVGTCVDISGDVVPGYLVSMPVDPLDGTANDSGYYMMKTAAGRITVGACDPERAAAISVTR